MEPLYILKVIRNLPFFITMDFYAPVENFGTTKFELDSSAIGEPCQLSVFCLPLVGVCALGGCLIRFSYALIVEVFACSPLIGMNHLLDK